MTFALHLRHQFQKAKFRDVPFEVAAADTAVGRRVALHEFPLRDKPATEDMGRKASEFVVEGFLIGDDYQVRMKRLMAALMQAGPGTLIHPSLGSLNVVLVSPGRLREQFIERRGIVTFSLTFCESGAVDKPSFTVDTQQAIEDAADAVHGPMQEDFVKEFSIAGAPSWSIDSITSEIRRATEVIANIRNGFGLDLKSLALLTDAAGQFNANLSALLKKPGDLATALITQVRSLTDFFDFNAPNAFSPFAAARRSVEPLKTMLGIGQYGKPGTETERPTVPASATPYRQQQAANQDAVFSLIRRTAVVEAARSVVFQPFNSFNEAVAVRDAVYDALEEEILVAPDAVYSALIALRVAVVNDIAARGIDLARLATVTLQDSMPALVLSYRLYGSTRYADELVQRNDLLNPLLVPGGVPLEVLSV